jgi:hypothetical protein
VLSKTISPGELFHYFQILLPKQDETEESRSRVSGDFPSVVVIVLRYFFVLVDRSLQLCHLFMSKKGY